MDPSELSRRCAMTTDLAVRRTIPLVVLAVLLGACSSDVVRLPDCVDCRPVEMTMNQTFEAELGWRIQPSPEPAVYEWIVADPGTMTVIGVEEGTRSEDPTEALDGLSHYSIITLEPTEPGTTRVRFELRDDSGELRQDLSEGQLNVLEITVEVDG
jgi:hypothetical protein